MVPFMVSDDLCLTWRLRNVLSLATKGSLTDEGDLRKMRVVQLQVIRWRLHRVFREMSGVLWWEMRVQRGPGVLSLPSPAPPLLPPVYKRRPLALSAYSVLLATVFHASVYPTPLTSQGKSSVQCSSSPSCELPSYISRLSASYLVPTERHNRKMMYSFVRIYLFYCRKKY